MPSFTTSANSPGALTKSPVLRSVNDIASAVILKVAEALVRVSRNQEVVGQRKHRAGKHERERERERGTLVE